MNLTIINRSTVEIKEKRGTLRSVATMHISMAKEITFSAAAVRQFGIVGGKFMHFGRENGFWYFLVNNDSTGFPITCSNIKKPLNAPARVNNSALVRMFLTTTKRKLGDKFYLHKTDSEHNKSPVIEIMTSKSVKEMGK